MTIDNIRDLLARFYEGLTTPAETGALKDFFRNTHDIPDDLKADAAVFRTIDAREETEIAVPEDLKAKIIASTVGSRRRTFSWRPAVGIAASLAVIIALSIALIRPSQTSENQYLAARTTGYTHEVVDSAEVVAVTNRMLTMLDRSLSKADRGARYAGKAIAVISNPMTVRFKD